MPARGSAPGQGREPAEEVVEREILAAQQIALTRPAALQREDVAASDVLDEHDGQLGGEGHDLLLNLGSVVPATMTEERVVVLGSRPAIRGRADRGGAGGDDGLLHP